MTFQLFSIEFIFISADCKAYGIPFKLGVPVCIGDETKGQICIWN
jgi:hypothetical protein